MPGPYGRSLLQIELAPLQQQLTLSLVPLGGASFDETLRYTFALGLTSAYLLEAESIHQPCLEFAKWHSTERGALQPAEFLPPEASVERSACAFVDFFRCAEGAKAPVAPRDWAAEPAGELG